MRIDATCSIAHMHRLLLELRLLLWKEWRLDMRTRSSVQALLLYVVCLAFVAAINLKGAVVPQVWNAVYWLVVVFAALNAVARSFLGETEGQLRYLYVLASPAAVMLAKLLYNTLLLLVLALLALLAFAGLLGVPLEDVGLFLLAVVLASASLSATLTLVAALAHKAGGRATLMAVLAMPLLLPALLGLARVGRAAVLGASAGQDLLLLGGLGISAIVLSLVLFPYLWQDA